MYHMAKQMGIPDSQIVLMLPEDIACTPRNPFAANVFSSNTHDVNLYDEDNIEVDYRGDDVTVANFIRLLTGRYEENTPKSKRLLSNEKSNVFVYMAGHGGDQFIKFRDSEILTSYDLAHSLKEMYIQKRYNELFLVVDTCQASTLLSSINAPNIMTIGSSDLGENSYSHGSDSTVGASLIDKFTHYMLKFIVKTDGHASLQSLVRYSSIVYLHCLFALLIMYDHWASML